MLKQRDIVLIPIPFTDLESHKKRPALIISNNNYNNANEDIVVVAITSNVEPRDFAITLTKDDLEEGFLKVTSMIRVDKIYTLNKLIVLKKFGCVKPAILLKIKDQLLRLVEQQKIPK